MSGPKCTHFTPIPQAEMQIPRVLPMDPEDRRSVAARLRIRPEKLIRQPCITLPDTEKFHAYFHWCTPTSESFKSGFILELPGEWLRQYGEDAWERLHKQMWELGRPTQQWVLMYGLSDDPEFKPTRMNKTPDIRLWHRIHKHFSPITEHETTAVMWGFFESHWSKCASVNTCSYLNTLCAYFPRLKVTWYHRQYSLKETCSESKPKNSCQCSVWHYFFAQSVRCGFPIYAMS